MFTRCHLVYAHTIAILQLLDILTEIFSHNYVSLPLYSTVVIPHFNAHVQINGYKSLLMITEKLSAVEYGYFIGCEHGFESPAPV